MDKRHDTVLETLMEQLIEGGAENMGLVFARVFDLAMQIERERFLGAQHYERSINRTPVLTLWAVVVAERLGFDRNTALTLGRDGWSQSV